MRFGARFGHVEPRLCYVREDTISTDFDIPRDTDGFLLAEGETLWFGTPNRQVSMNSPDDIIVQSSLLLLGEPGIGKSTALRQIQKRWEREQTGHTAWLEGAELTDATLEMLISKAIAGCISGSNEEMGLLVIDQLDETGQLASFPRRIARLLDKIPQTRLRVAIGCRAADVPAALKDSLGEAGFRVIIGDLCPLTRKAAERLSEARLGSSSGTFLDAATAAGAGVLASVPLTLDLLIRRFEAAGELTGRPVDLFQDGIAGLTGEWSERRTSEPSLSASQRIAIAERIAAAVVLGGVRLVSVREVSNGPSITLSDVVGGVEAVGSTAESEVTSAAVRETLGTALFAGRTGGQFAFTHSSIAACLAARYLVRREAPPAQLTALLVISTPDGAKTIPASLRETATWYVVLAPEHSGWLIEADPTAVADHSRLVDSPETRKLVVSGLLAHAEDVELMDRWRRSKRDMSFPGLDAALKEALPAAGEPAPQDWTTVSRMRLAISLAGESQTASLVGELVTLAAREDLGPYERGWAVDAAVGCDGTIAGPLLREVLGSLVDASQAAAIDPDDELRGHLLSALWPSYLSLAEALVHLRPRRNRQLIGSYRLFMLRLPQSISEDEIDVALDWAPNRAAVDDNLPHELADEPVGTSVEVSREFVDLLIGRALQGGRATSRLTAVAGLLRPRLRSYVRIEIPLPLDQVDAEGTETQRATMSWPIDLPS